jgi:hypothetical protein
MKVRQNNKAREISKITRTLKFIIRVLPSFLVCAISSVLIARYLFHIPAERTAVAAGVPLVSLFVIRRIFMAILPVPSEDEKRAMQKEKVPVWFFVCGLMVLVSVFVCLASLMSAGLYWWVDLTSFARASFDFATTLLYIGFGTFSVMVLVQSGLWKLIGVVMLEVARQLFLDIPRIIADHLFIGDPYFLHGAPGH